MKPHGFHREALEEYARAAEDYAKISPELGGRFYDEIEHLIGEICRAPTLYRRIRGPVRRHFSGQPQPAPLKMASLACPWKMRFSKRLKY
jgi:hypothetical protein